MEGKVDTANRGYRSGQLNATLNGGKLTGRAASYQTPLTIYAGRWIGSGWISMKVSPPCFLVPPIDHLGIGAGGSCGPYTQSERLDIYRHHCDQLISVCRP